jgi:predicted RNase H-like nuclease (RuvC/YqgF family)
VGTVTTGLVAAAESVVNGWGAAAVIVPVLIGALIKLWSDANSKQRQSEHDMREAERERSDLRAEVRELRTEAQRLRDQVSDLKAEVIQLKAELRNRGRGS